MKKITFLIISSFLFIYINACTGYTPIYSSSSFNYKIEDYSLKGEERLSNLIFRKLNNVSNKNNPDVKGIGISIETKKKKTPTVKNSAGKILEYDINLITDIIINDFLSENIILNQPVPVGTGLPGLLVKVTGRLAELEKTKKDLKKESKKGEEGQG